MEVQVLRTCPLKPPEPTSGWTHQSEGQLTTNAASRVHIQKLGAGSIVNGVPLEKSNHAVLEFENRVREEVTKELKRNPNAKKEIQERKLEGTDQIL